jgi:DNA polymerase I
MDVYTTFMLVEPLKNELKEKGEKLTELLLKVEVPLEPVLAQMEYTGIHIDILYLKELSQYLETELTALEKKAYEDAGEKFNLGSPKQLSTLLFDKLQLDTKKSRKIKTGFSTDAGVLEKLQGDHPLIDSILEYRTLDKLKSTYVDALPKLVRKDTQRVHTDFNQTITTTGRLSSSNPNLQNIPIRTEFSRKIRKAFIPEKGWLMVSADYSQIELRILAELSGEPLLIEAYKNNEDVHTVTAKLLFEKDNITPDERRVGKTINFGVIYGMGSGKFARSIGRTSAEGKEFIKRFQLRYAKVFEYLERVQKQAISQWYVETILGRRRYFKFEEGSSLGGFKGRSWDEIPLEKLQGNSRNDAANLRAASNAPIQGSSADIIKVAMIELHEILKNYQSRLLLQVHDELVLEVHPDEWEELQPLLKTTMETAIHKYRPLSVPLVVDINVGENWMDTK